MLFLIWILMHTFIFCDKFSKDRFQTPRKHSVYYPFHPNLDKTTQEHQHYKVLITGDSTCVLKQFWKSTGLCPPDPHQQSYKFLLSSDMKQNLFHIGSLPFQGITHVRIHWLLDLVYIRINPDFNISYNFTLLDELIFELWKNDLYLGFELMGNPSNYFSNFENNTQVYTWRDLVKSIANHYIDLYGIDYVMKWKFETWNEPDHHDFDKLNFTVKGFLNYYDACSEGLKLADKHLKFGGPGGSCRIPTEGHSPICWALIEHCLRGENFFTKKTGSRIDFISFHKKGNGSSFEILNAEKETIEYMRSIMKTPYNIPFYNDEADPMKNWALPQSWRADATYASLVTKIILIHINEYFMKNERKHIRFGLLSNDNAFLSYYPYQFTERTLLARFQVNNTCPKYVEFIKKPVYSALGLLSQLCPIILSTKVFKEGKKVSQFSNFGIIATRCPSNRNQTVIAMYNSADSILTNVTFDIDLILNWTSLNKNAKVVVLEINNLDTNPYLIWQKIGKPSYPTSQQFSLIKDYEEPKIQGPLSVNQLPSWKLQLQLLNPGVMIINICNTRRSLKMVEKVRFCQIRNNSLQISWSDNHNRCVYTYNVEYSIYLHGPYIQVNKKNIIFPSYWHSCSENGTCSVYGFYRVYAVDYWNIQGPVTIPVEFKGQL